MRHGAGCTRVTVTGRLTATDMRRLEHACSPALTAPALLLEIDLRGVTHTDATAAAVLQRMTKRGAVVTTCSGPDPASPLRSS
jgi:anti-anti-sigma regulatory factor